MIHIENIETFGWEAAVRGMRNPMDSWDKSDSQFWKNIAEYEIGKNDLDLMKRLIAGGTEHRKFLRMIHVQMDVVAPLYWWKEYDTYKVGTVSNSCSTMHKLMSRPLLWSDFSVERLNGSRPYMKRIIDEINACIKLFNETKNKDYWYEAVQLLPSSYNQRRTVDFNYEVAMTMIRQRKGHKLDEWNDFVETLETLPYMQDLIK